MPKLNRIILINTHLPGVVELNLNGHTNICGTNASGKTTLQRLLPVFYGEYPSRIVPSTRDSFERWYLPTESSFIIYEYHSMDDQCCQAVLAPANEGKGINYRFIHKAFELYDYQRESSQSDQDSAQNTKSLTCLTMAELGRKMKRLDVHHSRLINTREYRAIIQNDRSLLNISSNRNDLRQYVRYFSLCSTGHSLRHIEKLAKAVHSKEGKMETIKSMIAAILEEDGVSPPDYSLKSKEVEDWIRESKLIQGFEFMRPEFDKLEQEYQQLLSCEQQLSGLLQGYERDHSLQWQRQEESKNKLEQLGYRQTALKKNWQEQLDTINLELSATKGDIHKTEEELDQIEKQYTQYLESNIEQAQLDLEQLSSWHEDLDHLEDQHKLMITEHQDIEADYQKRLNKINYQLNLTLEKLHTEQDEQQDDLDTKKQQKNDDLNQIEQQFTEYAQTLKETFNQQQSQLIIQQTSLQVHIDSVNYTKDENQALVIFDKRIQETIEDINNSKLRLENQQQQNDHLRKGYTSAESIFLKTSQQLTKCEAQVDDLKRLLFPGHNSLLEFLRRENSGWETTLGKVIQPELLHSTNLKPEKSVTADSVDTSTVLNPVNTITANTDSFYGLHVDLAAIPLPAYALSEQQHEQNLKKAEERVHEALNLKNEAEETLRNISRKQKELTRKISISNTEYKKHNHNLERLYDEKNNRKNEIDAALAERKDKARKQLTQLDHELKQLKLEQEIQLKKLQTQNEEERLEKTAYWQEVIRAVENHIQQLKASIKERSSKAKTEQTACHHWYTDQLKARGVDEKELNKLEQQREDLHKKISKTERRRDEVLEYNHWFKQSWIKRKPNLQKELTQDKTQEALYEQQLKAEKIKYKTERSELQEQEQQAHIQQNEAQEYLKRIDTLKKKIKELKLSPNNDEPMGDIGERLRQGDELLLNREELLISVKTYVEHFENLIANQSGSSLAETWERSREECTQINDKGIHLLDHRKLVVHLEQLLNVMVPQSIHALREQGRIFGINLNAYYDVLADIDRRITSQSHRITRELDEDLFLDGVSNSAVRIRSRINELDFWPELKTFITNFLKWQEDGFSTMPDEDYTTSMKRAIDIIGRSALSGSMSSLLEIELHLREGNSNLIIRTDRQLTESSSHGMAYLILCKFLLAFTRLLRKQSNVTVHWPIDELGTLHHDNIKKIFDACVNNNILILGAFPNPDSEVLDLFSNRYIINKQSKKLQIVKPRLDLLSEKFRQRQSKKEVV